jgi:hypothetical protein
LSELAKNIFKETMNQELVDKLKGLFLPKSHKRRNEIIQSVTLAIRYFI